MPHRRPGRTPIVIGPLFHAMFNGSIPRFAEFEMGWVSEANVASVRAITHVIPMVPRKTYRLYEAPLPLG
jgi:hypothetical protein